MFSYSFSVMSRKPHQGETDKIASEAVGEAEVVGGEVEEVVCIYTCVQLHYKPIKMKVGIITATYNVLILILLSRSDSPSLNRINMKYQYNKMKGDLWLLKKFTYF